MEMFDRLFSNHILDPIEKDYAFSDRIQNYWNFFMMIALILPALSRLLTHYLLPLDPIIRRSYELNIWTGITGALFYAHTTYIFQCFYLAAILTSELNLLVILDIEISHKFEFLMAIALGSLLYSPYLFIFVILICCVNILYGTIKLIPTTSYRFLQLAIIMLQGVLIASLAWPIIYNTESANPIGILLYGVYVNTALLVLEIRELTK